MKIDLSIDGNQYCVLIGANPQEGVEGFGDTAAIALRNLSFEIEKQLLRSTFFRKQWNLVEEILKEEWDAVVAKTEDREGGDQ